MEKKKKYSSPTVTFVKLNPSQAVLSICSTTAKNIKATGSGTRCRSKHCQKRDNHGDSLGNS